MRTALTAAAAACAIMGAICSAATQATYEFRLSPPVVTPASAEVEVAVWAIFDPADFALHWAALHLEAGDGEFFVAWCFLNCGIAPPTPDQRFVWNINARQFGCPPDTKNPIAIAGAMWRPDSLETRDVSIATITSSLAVQPTPGFCERFAIRPVIEGSGIIRVRRCYADCDGTDDLDFFDFLCFQDAFATGDFYADCDGSGELDFFDFLCFQNEFALGCG